MFVSRYFHVAGRSQDFSINSRGVTIFRANGKFYALKAKAEIRTPVKISR
jgi:hypothetical protein